MAFPHEGQLARVAPTCYFAQPTASHRKPQVPMSQTRKYHGRPLNLNVSPNDRRHPMKTKPSLKYYRSLLIGKKCMDCYPETTILLAKQEIEHYNHENGWPLNGHVEKQWLFITCPNCRYQWSFAKLGIPQTLLLESQGNEVLK